LAFVPDSENAQSAGTVLEVPELASVLKSWVYAVPKELRETSRASIARSNMPPVDLRKSTAGPMTRPEASPHSPKARTSSPAAGKAIAVRRVGGSEGTP